MIYHLKQSINLILLDEKFRYCQGNVKFSDACIIACTSNQLNAQEFLVRNFSLKIHSSESNEMYFFLQRITGYQ